MRPTDAQLHAYADGQLPPAVHAEVGRQVQADPAAATTVADIRATGDRLRATPLPLPSVDAHDRWLLAWQFARDRAVRRLAGWMSAAAAVVLGVTLASAYSSDAAASPALAEWETAAVGSADDEESPRTARVIAADLSLPATTPEAGR